MNTALGAVNTIQTLRDKNASGKDKAFAGARGANQIYGSFGGPGAGYVGAGINAAEVLSSDASGKQKAKALNRAGEDIAANIGTAGVSGLVQSVDRQFLGGQTDKARDKIDEFENSKLNMIINPMGYFTNKFTDKLQAKALDKLGASGKGKDQQVSDQYRKVMKDAGIINLDQQGNWMITLRDNKGNAFDYDIGKDGGGGRKYHELDPSKSFEADGVTPSLQGRMQARGSALGDLITGADEKQGTKFAGYFANAGLKAAQGDEEAGRAAMRDLYSQFGYKNADSAISGIEALRKAGKIDDERAAAQIGTIRSIFTEEETPKQSTSDQKGTLLDTNQDDAKQALQFKRAR